VSTRAAEDAVAQASTLLDGIVRLESDLLEADARMEAALRPWPGTLPDPLAALRLVDEADVALDAALAAARDEQAQRQRSVAILDQALLAARSGVAAASGFIATRRGAVGTGARTRLVEAQRRLQKATALSEQDPTQALQEAQHADQLAQAALQVAQSDVDQWSTPYGGDRFLEIASLVLGGILLGGGGSGESGGGFGGRSPGSFGGSGSGGRRGGGGRF
jgi:hypothetical protein